MQGLFRTVASWWCESFIGTYEAKEVVKHHSGFTRLQVPFIRVDDHGLCFINFWFSIFFSIFDSPRGNGWGLRQSSGSAWTSKLDLCRSQCHAERPKAPPGVVKQCDAAVFFSMAFVNLWLFCSILTKNPHFAFQLIHKSYFVCNDCRCTASIIDIKTSTQTCGSGK